jgi:hypothetical protein
MPTSSSTTCPTCLAELEGAWEEILTREGLPAELAADAIEYDHTVDPEQLAS